MTLSIVVASGSVRSDIEDVRVCFFLLLLTCTLIVFIGVIVEGIEHLLPKGKPYIDTESGVFNATPLIEWHKKLERLGWLLVIVGVLGEGIFEALTSSADNTLQDFNNTLLAVATDQAGNAAASAKIAHKEADAATVSATEAQQKSDAANVTAGKAVASAAVAQRRIAELNGQLIATNKQLDAVDAKRAELKVSLESLAICNAPRVIPQWHKGKQGFADPLKPFARQAIIEYIVEPEPLRAAENIGAALKEAGWTITAVPLSSPIDWGKIPDGVRVYPYDNPTPDETKREQTPEWYSLVQSARESTDAAKGLVTFLHSNNWTADWNWLLAPKTIPPGSIDITVGLYPANTFVVPSAEKDFMAELEEHRKAREQNSKQMDQAAAEREDRYLKTLPPEQAKAVKARNEKMEKEWKEREAKENEADMVPCRPLNPLSTP
jgi:hypothetical protein